jgi:hypothetical protein
VHLGLHKHPTNSTKN